MYLMYAAGLLVYFGVDGDVRRVTGFFLYFPSSGMA
jgi:hypothetical protein